MKTIVTGSAGFIGSALTANLLKKGNIVLGIDNHNDYYDPQIKEARLERLKKYSPFHSYENDFVPFSFPGSERLLATHTCRQSIDSFVVHILLFIIMISHTLSSFEGNTFSYIFVRTK